MASSSSQTIVASQNNQPFPTLFEFVRQRLSATHTDLFLASVVAALTESDENPFCIDFDTAVGWLDVQKAHLKRTLTSNPKLRLNVDYKFISKNGENKPQVGRPPEELRA